MNKSKLKYCVLAFMMSIIGVNAQSIKEDSNNPYTTQELRIRNGLPNFFKKINTGKKVTVAYLGGSITHQEGWRPKTFYWLEKQYPKTVFKMINAAVPGTGSEFGNCRLEKDAISKNPDLVFVEFRVNGSGGFGIPAYEGLVRQIWTNNPNTDICFVYTIGEGMLKNISKGLQHGEGIKLEKTAIHYNIPSIDFGLEVVKQLSDGNFVFRSKTIVTGKKIFAKDAVHPKDDGHELYQKIVARSLIAMESIGTAGKHKLPKPLTDNHFAEAELISIKDAVPSKGWNTVVVAKDQVYKDDIFRTSQMLGDAVKSDKVEATLTVDWEGHTIGFSTIPLGKGSEIEVITDGDTAKLYKIKMKPNKNPKKEPRKFARFFYTSAKTEGKHTTVFKINKLAKGESVYMGQFLVFKKPIE
ncbi:hypothetical protein Q4595_07635 [Wenyingzhuangia sp. 1_MG-2023]|nr:hypothetical protein [Wenyingzhuangia sp. 1_MG-2023]